jgi:hypothetical protein
MEMKKAVKVSNGYRCPFCPNHRDNIFYESDLVGRPICEGCEVELDIFCEREKRPEDHLIDALEKHTGLSWQECRKVLLKEKLAEWKRLAAEQPEEWMKSTMKVCNWTREQTITYLHQQVGRIQSLIAGIGN